MTLNHQHSKEWYLMGMVSGLTKVAKGAVVGVAAITALPVFGAVGAITATGVAVGAIIGAVAGIADEVIDEKKAKSKAKNS